MAIRKSLALAMAVAGISGPVAGIGGPALAGIPAPPLGGLYVGGAGGWGGGPENQSGGIFHLPSSCSSGSTLVSFSGTSFCQQIVADGSYNLSGALVGGTVGYNFQQGRWLYGPEADISWADISGSGTCGFGGALPHACGGDVRWLATVRGRLGYDLGPVIPAVGHLIAYATGGLAVGDIHAWDSLLGTSGTKTEAGWTVGAGLEAMLNANWSVKLEYLYMDFGNPAIFTAIPPNPEHVSTKLNVVRVGLNYHFNWTPPPPPIVTKVTK
jgi:outer membrane immunogenic protein